MDPMGYINIKTPGPTGTLLDKFLVQSPLGPFYSLLQQALWTARPVVQDACEEYQEVLRHEPHCRAVRLHLATRGGNQLDRRD